MSNLSDERGPAQPIPLSYSVGDEANRPKLLIPLGVASIVVAAVQGLIALAVTIGVFAYVRDALRSTGRSASGSELTLLLSVLSFLLAVVSVVLAAVLLMAGLRTLRGRLAGRRLHLMWAVAKIGVESAAAIVSTLWLIQIFSDLDGYAVSIGANHPTRPTTWYAMLAARAAVQWALYMIYPTIVLIVLTRRRMQAYFSTAPE